MKAVRCILLSLIIITSVLSTFALAAAEGAFADVPNDHWAADEIEHFKQKNIVDGVGSNLFEPDSQVTREEFCKIIVRTFDRPENYDGEQIFTDVPPERWSYPYVNMCKEFLTGYVNPFDNSMLFKPDAYATREDIAVALIKMMGVTAIGHEENYYIFPSDNFKDAEEVSPALRRYVYLAYEYKLINGYPDGTFRPREGITRAETVVLLDRATKQAFSDVTGEIKLEISEFSNSFERAEIDIVTDPFANVTIDGVGAEMGSYGVCRYNLYYGDSDEKTIIVTASRFGKTVTKQFTVKRNSEDGKPTIIFSSEIPTETRENNVVLSGSVHGKNGDNLQLTINGVPAPLDANGGWKRIAMLAPGSNLIMFSAVNQHGQETSVIKSVYYDNSEITPPEKPLETTILTLELAYHEYSATDVATIIGTVTDSVPLSNIKVVINGGEIILYLKNKESFEQALNLKVGTNKFIIEAYSETSDIVYREISILYEEEHDIEEEALEDIE